MPGNDFLDPNVAAMRVLAHGLERLGILPSADEALRDDKQFYKRYSLHNVSHMLGLDVHDCAHARQETYKYGQLAPGMVLTVEPGIYWPGVGGCRIPFSRNWATTSGSQPQRTQRQSSRWKQRILRWRWLWP